jgi:hypothetical protein
MGTGGTFTGDPAPGSKTTVQKKFPAQSDRDWRYVGTVLPVQFLSFSGAVHNTTVPLSWKVITAKDIDHFEIERSLDNTAFIKVGEINEVVKLNIEQSFGFTDNVSGISNEIIYYRLKVIGKAGEIKYSNILVVKRSSNKTLITIMPNPASNYVTINLSVDKNIRSEITIIDKVGKKVLVQNENLTRGANNITLDLNKYNEGVYAIIIETAEERIIKQLIIVR